MVKSILAIVVVATTIGITGCATRAETVGTAGGAVAGGALGSAASGGSTLGTLGGAPAGAYPGDPAWKAYHPRHLQIQSETMVKKDQATRQVKKIADKGQ